MRPNGFTVSFFLDRLDGSKLLLNPMCDSEDSSLDVIIFLLHEGQPRPTRMFGFGRKDVPVAFKNFSEGFKEEVLNLVENTVIFFLFFFLVFLNPFPG